MKKILKYYSIMAFMLCHFSDINLCNAWFMLACKGFFHAVGGRSATSATSR